MTYTHTYAVLPVPKATYDEIASKLKEAGYGDNFHQRSDDEVIDMHGIALGIDPSNEPPRVRIKQGWGDAGREGLALAVMDYGCQQSWTAVLWDEDDKEWKFTDGEDHTEPSLHKTAGLEPA